jgi:flagellar basal-body rod protein FlgC
MKGLLTSTRAMEVQDKRMLIIAQNMAHAGVRATNPDVDPYRAKTIGFKEAYDREMEFHYPKISKEGRDPRPFKIIYAPGDPGANEEGFVKETNVDSMIEMANMRETNLSHRANLKAYEKILSMIQETLTLLKE